jgi:hypothetical protein
MGLTSMDRLYKIEVSDADLGLVRVALGALPHDQVRDLIDRIGDQVRKQTPEQGAVMGRAIGGRD